MTTTVKDMLAAANAAVPRISGAEAQALAGQPHVVLLDIRDGSEVAAVSYTHLTLPTNREV